jgi:uracil-DNA glycosylase
MSDLTSAEEVASLVADVLSHLEALRTTGTASVPQGPVIGLPPAEARAPVDLRAGRSAEGPATRDASGAVGGVSRPAGAFGPRVAASSEPASAAVFPRPALGASSTQAAATPAPTAASGAPTSGGLAAGLFGGQWAALASDPAQELQRLRSALPASCHACGSAPVQGRGPARARIAVVSEPLDGPASEVFDRMLVNVLVLERADVLLFELPRDCDPCAARVRAELEVVRPRAVAFFGPRARALPALEPGTSGRFVGAEAFPTWHPRELAARPELRRPTFEHLKALSRHV